MKPEKAISIINDYDVYFEGHTAEEIVDAMEFAIEALQKQIPKPVEETHVLRTETHAVRSDTISRQAAIDALSHMCSEDENGITVSRANVDSMLRYLPSAQPKTGWWLDDNGRPYKGKPNNSCWCSECGEWLVASDEYNASTSYCPNCGVRMLNGGE